METIEERVEAYYNMWLYGGYSIEWVLREIATEQDRISRADERERCIKVMQDWYCNNNCICNEKYGKCPMGSVHACDNILLIRKAMEGGAE